VLAALTALPGLLTALLLAGLTALLLLAGLLLGVLLRRIILLLLRIALRILLFVRHWDILRLFWGNPRPTRQRASAEPVPASARHISRNKL
jgi:hypothetical protein